MINRIGRYSCYTVKFTAIFAKIDKAQSAGSERRIVRFNYSAETIAATDNESNLRRLIKLVA